ncbi:MAG TPA: hypothetical protein VGL72_02370 [Bryobacteraceae bacterium]|jgi:hypothetical protein
MRKLGLSAFLFLSLQASFAIAAPSAWVPMRWPWSDTQSLELLDKSPINTILLPPASPLASAAAARGFNTMLVVRSGSDPQAAADEVRKEKLAGLVLEGSFPPPVMAKVRDTLAGSQAIVVELTSRSTMHLASSDPIIGTYQGVWPGIQVTDNGKAKAGPSGSAWIDTNSGFLRAVRAFDHESVWLGNTPPTDQVVRGERYLQAIGDAGMVGARWIVALDDHFAADLHQRDAGAMKTWSRMLELLRYYESHPEWRTLPPGGKLAVVQDAEHGSLLSGGILDMIGVKHTPVRAIPPQKLSPDALQGATMAVNVEPGALNPQQAEILRNFTKSGGTLLTAPPGADAAVPSDKNRITLNDDELKHIDDLWHDVQNMIGRKNLGVRLFNVASMLSNLENGPNGSIYVQLVNYSEYGVENVTVHALGKFKKAHVYMPGGVEKDLEIYDQEDGSGVDLDKVDVVATVRFDL